MIYSNLQRLLWQLSEYGYDPHRERAPSLERLAEAVLRENDLSEIPWDRDTVLLLGCVAHDKGDTATVASIIAEGLRHSSVVTRDAAVTLCDLNLDAHRGMLEAHDEPEEWLRGEIRKMIEQP